MIPQSEREFSGSDETVALLVERARIAQASVEGWSQNRIDEAVAAIGWHAYKDENARNLSRIAVEETGMGLVNDHFTRHRKRILGILRDLRGVITSGEISEDLDRGIRKIAKPVGIVGAITPSTGPTAAIVAIALTTAKTRNAAIFCPNPAAKRTVRETVKILRTALRTIGAPVDLIQTVSEPTRERLSELMSSVDLVLASGGRGTVRRAYMSGTPAYGAGIGNAVVVVDETANLPDSASRIMAGKCFDNGTSCSAESCIVVAAPIWALFLDEIRKLGAYVCNESETARLREAAWPDGKTLNRTIVGKNARQIGILAGIEIPDHARAIAVLCNERYVSDPFGGEKLSPILSIWKYQKFDEAVDLVRLLTAFSGSGHSCGIYSSMRDRIDRLANEIKVSRVMVNQSTGLGNTGSFENGMPFTVVLSCGTWGGSTTTDNITWRHLLNYTSVSHAISGSEPKPEDFFSGYWSKYPHEGALDDPLMQADFVPGSI
jgi:sulfoacetaldehyde dehydrogenase